MPLPPSSTDPYTSTTNLNHDTQTQHRRTCLQVHLQQLQHHHQQCDGDNDSNYRPCVEALLSSTGDDPSERLALSGG